MYRRIHCKDHVKHNIPKILKPIRVHRIDRFPNNKVYVHGNLYRYSKSLAIETDPLFIKYIVKDDLKQSQR